MVWIYAGRTEHYPYSYLFVSEDGFLEAIAFESKIDIIDALSLLFDLGIIKANVTDCWVFAGTEAGKIAAQMATYLYQLDDKQLTALKLVGADLETGVKANVTCDGVSELYVSYDDIIGLLHGDVIAQDGGMRVAFGKLKSFEPFRLFREDETRNSMMIACATANNLIMDGVYIPFMYDGRRSCCDTMKVLKDLKQMDVDWNTYKLLYVYNGRSGYTTGEFLVIVDRKSVRLGICYAYKIDYAGNNHCCFKVTTGSYEFMDDNTLLLTWYGGNMAQAVKLKRRNKLLEYSSNAAFVCLSDNSEIDAFLRGEGECLSI